MNWRGLGSEPGQKDGEQYVLTLYGTEIGMVFEEPRLSSSHISRYPERQKRTRLVSTSLVAFLGV